MCTQKETVLWGELDRWDYTDLDGIPPPYSEYTGLSLKWTFILFFLLSMTQILFILLVKIYTSKAFSVKNDFMNKFLHLFLCLNIPYSFEDWDQGRFSVKQYKERHHKTNIEMAWCLSVNIFSSFLMLTPLWYTGIGFTLISFHDSDKCL